MTVNRKNFSPGLIGLRKTIKFLPTLFVGIFYAAILSVSSFAQQAALLPQGKQQFLDNNGNPLSSGKVFFYIPSTTTFKTTWQDAGKTIANTNPVILDAGGRAIIYGDGTYRQQVRASNNNLIYDVVTASAGTGGGTTGTGDGDLVGTVKPWAGLVAPNQYVFAYGQEISRTTYAAYFTATTLNQNLTCSSGSPTLTGLSDTTQIPIGATLESICIAPGATVISATSTTVTMNTNASLTTSTTGVFFPYGNGNGSTTFNVPDLRGYVVAGRCNMGGVACGVLSSSGMEGGASPNAIGAKGGSQLKTLVTSNLPPYTPSGSVGNVTAAGTVSTPIITLINGTNLIANTAGTSFGGGGVGTPVNVTASSSTPTFTGTPVSGGTFTGAAQGGTSTAFSNLQPTQTLNYIVKITPDQNSADASGVTSLGLMTGDIACGTGLLCTSNTISVTNIAVGAPVFILATGQSNFVESPALSWSPAPNLRIWNNVLDVDGSIGTSFTTAPGTVINAATRMASEIAYANPLSTIYLLNVSYGSMGISHWLPGTGAPDIYANILANIVPALAAANMTTINLFTWWQGDADRLAYQTYLADFNTLITRFETNSWYPLGISKFIWGIASSADTGDTTWDDMNRVLQAVVAQNPFDRQFFSPAMFPASYWTGNITGNHMNAQGYYLAGQAAAASYLTGTGVKVLQNTGVDILSANAAMGTLPDISRLALGKGSSITRLMQAPMTLSDTREAMMHLQGADGFANISTIDAFGGPNVIPWLAFRSARGTSTTPTATQNGDYLGIMSGDGYGASIYSVGAGEYTIQATENFTNTANGTKAAIRLTPTGSTTRTDRFTIAGDGTLGIFGATSGVTLLRASAIATTGTLTFPNGTDTLVGQSTTDTLFNKTIGTGGLIFTNATSGSITLTPPAGALGTVTLTMPAVTTNLVGTDTIQNLSNKTILTTGLGFSNATSGKITVAATTGALGTPTITLPAVTTTMVGTDATQILTNKTFDTASNTAFKINGTTLNAVAGTSATVALNTEGTFVPVLQFGGASTGITYSTQSGDYVRTGNRVDVWINIVLTSKGSATGNATIASLPFTSAQTAIGAFQMNGGAAAVTTMTTSNVAASGTSITLQKFSAGSASTLQETDIANTTVLRVSISYRI